jgi:hypothetical protein
MLDINTGTTPVPGTKSLNELSWLTTLVPGTKSLNELSRLREMKPELIEDNML